MVNKKIIFYIILIVVVLGLVFLSQQAYSKDIIKNISAFLSKYGGASLLGAFNSKPSNNNPSDSSSTNNNPPTNPSNGDNSYKLTGSAYNSSQANTTPSVSSNIVDKVGLTVSGLSENVANGLRSGGEAVTNAVDSAKENISTAEKNVVNYFSGISNAIQGKENNYSSSQCPPNQ